MFEKLMNSYYYGKSGKGDYTPEDLPKNRWQLFWEMLRTRLSALVRLNLMYLVIWLPAMIVIMWSGMGIASSLNYVDNEKAGTTEVIEVNGETASFTYISEQQLAEVADGTLFLALLLLIPCVTITGPFTAGVSYVTRNWSRDEHAFIWSDFKDAVKANWKQSLLVSFITSLIPAIMYTGWTFYGRMSATQPFMAIPQVLVVMLGVMWYLALTYMHPLIVSYHLKFRDLMRNAFLLAVARLPMSVGIRLLHVVPMALCLLLALVINNLNVLILAPFLWYAILGFALSRFVTASYTNGVFDRYINSRMEGVQINRGLAAPDDDDDEDDADAEDNA